MSQSILVLSGGVGGAKLCLGLQGVVGAENLRIAVNTGDDFEHLGLYVCPDIDTMIYTLSGLANSTSGWGRQDESWNFMSALGALGGETWFRLGDTDLAMHVERTLRRARGESLSAITAHIAERLGIRATVFPMSDDEVRTEVITADDELGFQHYFVRLRCEPAVESLRFIGHETANISEPFTAALRSSDLRAIVIAPSNPYLSIDPILSLPGLREAIRHAGVPVIAVSPIIGDAAVKGPTAKIMRELGIRPSPGAIADHYRELIDGFVLDARDASAAGKMPVPVHLCDTLMMTDTDRRRVARAVLDFIPQLHAARRTPPRSIRS